MNNLRLAIANDWYDKKSAIFWNKDGFLKALHNLREIYGWETKFFKKHERTFEWEHDYVDLSFSPDPKQQILDWKPDAILFFSDLSRPLLGELKDSGIPIAICLTGGTFVDYINVPNIIFVESQTYFDVLGAKGANVMRAFGTNEEIFYPDKRPKIFDAVFPATFANWKRHNLFAEAMEGAPSAVCGWFQPSEPNCWQVCKDKGVALFHHQLPESVNDLYNMSKTCLITAESVGGSQRTVLEAMACNIPVIVTSDSEKTSEYLIASGTGSIIEPDANKLREEVERVKDTKVTTRDWILENYSSKIYAEQLKKGIESIL